MSIEGAENLRVGLIGEALATVSEKLAAKHVGSGTIAVYATPSMLSLMEAASLAAIEPYLPDHLTSVGIAFNVRHLSGTPLGEQVTAICEITAIEGKRILLEARVWDEHNLIGEGSLTRYLIEAERFMQGLRREQAE